MVGVEPHLPLVARARRRVCGEGSAARVVAGDAEALPLGDDSIDVVHARWAYFFGAGCEPGLAEVERVLRPGGIACVVDNDATRSTFGSWFRRAYPAYDSVAVQRFWDRQGFTTDAPDDRLDLRPARGPRGRRPHRAPARACRRRARRPTTGSPSTTRSPCAGSASDRREAPCRGQRPSSSRVRARRSFVIARCIARRTTGAATAPNPEGDPWLRRLIRVDPVPRSSKS